MKFYILSFVFLLTSAHLSAQDSKGQIERAEHWSKKTVFNAGGEEIEFQLGARYKRDNDRKAWKKSLVINDSSYDMIKKDGAINIVDQYGNTVLKTDTYRSVFYTANNQIFKRGKLNRFTQVYEIVNAAGEVVVSGKIDRKEIDIRIHQPLLSFKNLLAAMCFEELLQMRRDYDFADVSNVIFYSYLLM